MNRSSGAGLLGLGIVLVVVGAILEFAVTATAKGFSVHTVGIILLWVGIVAFVLGLVFMITGGSTAWLRSPEGRRGKKASPPSFWSRCYRTVKRGAPR